MRAFLRLTLVVVLVCSAGYAGADQVKWLTRGPETLVASSVGYEGAVVNGKCWQGTIADGTDPQIQLTPVDIDAARAKYLYIRLSSQSGVSMQVFFSDGGPHTEAASFHADQIVPSGKPVTYRLDLSKFPAWKGKMRSIRIDIDGASKGSVVALYGVGLSVQRVGTVAGEPVVVGSPRTASQIFNDRMAAWHETMVAIDEMRPNACVTTYVKDKFTYWDSYGLAKLVTGVEVNGELLLPENARGVIVRDIPGGVRATYQLGGVKVTTEIVPLLIGRGTPQQEGAAVLSVRTEPAATVVVRCGGAMSLGWTLSRASWLRGDRIGSKDDSAVLNGGIGVLKNPLHPFAVAVTCSGELKVEPGADGGQILAARFANGSGRTLVCYSTDQTEAVKLAGRDARALRGEAGDYYTRLMKCRVETPEKLIDQAFRSALCTLEYNWLEPYGWNECIHHWLALWHMQHTGGVEWIGQADRSRLCNVTTAENLLPDGSAPQFSPTGMTRKDFGGSNQFFAWQVRHYWHFTGDRDAIAKLAGPLGRVIEQTFRQYDPDNDGLLAWGQQIGNQEDYVSTPFNGTSPTIEGINMLLTASEFARALGQTRGVLNSREGVLSSVEGRYAARAQTLLARLRAELWQPDLGRFMFYKDPYGVARPDGQYHTQIYPVIWGISDLLDSWTSLRHLRDRMIGAGGETYCSNNFPCHVECTCGPQAGAAQQPWAAWGLAAMGLRNETYRPLLAVSKWVMNEDHRGSWPEVAVWSTPAYFSPPAGLFVQSTIEALFGLQVNKPAGYLTVAPSFPDHWPYARLNLPDYSANYTHKGNRLVYVVRSRASLARRARWSLPPCALKSVTANGKPVRGYHVDPGVNCMILRFDLPRATATRIEIAYEPLAYRIECPKSVAEGDTISVEASNYRIAKVDDRCGVLSEWRLVSPGRLMAGVREGLLSDYGGFGRLGQMNFSRRTFFVLCSGSGRPDFWKSVDLAILPRYECAAQGEIERRGEGAAAKLLIRNNTSAQLKGTASLTAARGSWPLEINIAPRSERVYEVAIPASHLALLSPGDNAAKLLLPGARELKLTIIASELLKAEPKLADYARSRTAPVDIPDALLIADTEWMAVRRLTAYGHYPWAGSKPPMEGLDGPDTLKLDGLPGVEFRPKGRKFAPVSWNARQPVVTLDMGAKRYKKFYLLVIPFLDNHDTFIPVARIDIRGDDGVVLSRTLRSPGDLDWWNAPAIVGDFATDRKARPSRFGLLPLLGPNAGDWEEGKPPAFPQPEYWATCRTYRTKTVVMNVVEVDLGQAVAVKSLSITALGADPALGLVAVSAENVTGPELLGDTPFLPPVEFREPVVVFDFRNAGDLLGWQTEGNAFAVAPVPGLFTVPTLNSLAAFGEMATGKATSPEFTIGRNDQFLRLEYQGGTSLAEDGPGTLMIILRDAQSGALLRKLPASGSHVLREGLISLDGLQGKRVRLEMVDLNTGTSFAWLGIRRVELVSGGSQ